MGRDCRWRSHEPGGEGREVRERELADKAKVIAVVGASPDIYRPSNTVMRYLVAAGYDVRPVRPGGGTIYGRACVDSLSQIDVPIDIVDVFRNPGALVDVAKEAAQVGAKCLWLQEGLQSAEAARIAREAGLEYVENRCIKKVLNAVG